MQFYTGPYDFLYKKAYANTSLSFVVEGVRSPAFRMSVNKVAELVELFLPTLYHQNPAFTVEPSRMELDQQTMMGLIPPEEIQRLMMSQQQGAQVQDPTNRFRKSPMEMARLQAGSDLTEYYLNSASTENGLRENIRQSITEALIKGRGLQWIELIQGAGGKNVVASLYDSVDHLFIDPDAEDLKHAKWIARRRVQSIPDVSRRFGLPEKKLKEYGNALRKRQDNLSEDGGEVSVYDNDYGESYETIVYYDFYSRMGIGGDLAGVDQDKKEALKDFGQHAMLSVAEGIPFPLNLPPSALRTETMSELKVRISWPTPFYEDPLHPWPFVNFDFHQIPRSVWPMSHIRPAMGELKALQWCMSYLLGKIVNISRDLIVLDKTVEEDIKEKIINGPDLTVLEVPMRGGQTVDKLIQWIKSPEFNQSIWEVINVLEKNFERRTGVSELAFGQSGRQMRSATEAQVKQQALSVRPDDMAAEVEAAMSVLAKNHAIAAKVHLSGDDIGPVFGEVPRKGMPLQNGETTTQYGPMTNLWMDIFKNQEISEIVSEYSFTVAEGSARLRNKAAEREDAIQMIQNIIPIASGDYQQWGDPSVLNKVMDQWYKSLDIPDTERVYFTNRQQEMQQMQQAAAQQDAEKQQPQGTSQ